MKRFELQSWEGPRDYTALGNYAAVKTKVELYLSWLVIYLYHMTCKYSITITFKHFLTPVNIQTKRYFSMYLTPKTHNTKIGRAHV